MRSAVALLVAAVSAYAQGGGPPPLRWQSVRARDGAFTVSMPGQAEYEAQTLTAKNGRPVQYATYTVDLGTSAYMVSTSDYDDKTRISVSGAIEGVLGTWKNPRIVSRAETKLYGRPGQVVEFVSGKYRVTMRAFAVGRRLYQLGFIETMDGYVPAHRDRFLNSFTLR